MMHFNINTCTTSKCIYYISEYENDKLAMVLKIEDILDICYGCNFERRHGAVIIEKILRYQNLDIKKILFFFHYQTPSI